MRVGREQQREELREWVRGGARGRGSRLIVEGEPGAGRTALVREALAEAAALGCRVRYGAADPFTAGLPLRAALDCLHPDGPERAAVVALLREAGEAAQPGGAWLAALDLLVSGVEGWCARGPLLLVLDDLHWADPASLLLWQRLARSVDRLPLLLAATRRPLPRRAEVERLCAGLGAGPGGRTVRLEPLTEPETAEALRRTLGAEPGPRLLRAAARAGGNPRLLRELTAQWSGLVATTTGAPGGARAGPGDAPRATAGGPARARPRAPAEATAESCPRGTAEASSRATAPASASAGIPAGATAGAGQPGRATPRAGGRSGVSPN